MQSIRRFPTSGISFMLILLLQGSWLCSVGLSDLVFIANHSFESTTLPSGTFATASAPPGWSAYGNINFSNLAIGSLNPNGTTLYTDAVPDGNNVGVVFMLDDFFNQSIFNSNEGGLQQTLTTSLQSNTRYTLTVNVGNIANDSNLPHSQFQFSGFLGTESICWQEAQ